MHFSCFCTTNVKAAISQLLKAFKKALKKSVNTVAEALLLYLLFSMTN